MKVEGMAMPNLYETKPQNLSNGTNNISTNQLRDSKFERQIYLPTASYFNNNVEKPNKAAQNGDEKENIPKLIRSFLGYTTAHGFSRLEGSKGVFWKVFWALVCLGSFGMFTFQVHGLFELYLSRPVSTNVRITFETQVPFPAVTICNLNMMRTSEMPKELKREMLKLVGAYNASSPKNNTKARRRRRDVSTNPPTTPLTRYSDAIDTAQNLPTTQNPSSTTQNPSSTTQNPSSTTQNPSSTTQNPTAMQNLTKTENLPDTQKPSDSRNLTATENTPSTKSPTTTKDTVTTYGKFHTTKGKEDFPWHKTTSRSYWSTTRNSWSHTTHRSTYDYYYPYISYEEYKGGDREYLPSKEEVDENVLFLERFTTAVTKTPVEILKPAGHQWEDFVTECTWRGLDCRKSNYSSWWFQRWHYKYGNCYTFNGGLDQNNEPIRILSTSKPGPSQGLSLRLNIQQDEYLKYVSAEAGVRVIMHDQGVMPFPYLEGFSVSPGTATSVGIQKTVISRVDRFSNHTCMNVDELGEDNIYKKFLKITKYTQQTCHNSCIGKTQFKECGCSEYSYPSNKTACDAFNRTTMTCLWKIQHRFNTDQLPCMKDCRQPCREDIIQKTISMSQWPSTPYQEYEKDKHQNFSAKSSLLLNIFYNELNYQRIEEAFVYDEVNLLADIGGQLGLWIGVSVITVFELIELFVLILTRLFGRRKNVDSVNDMAIP